MDSLHVTRLPDIISVECVLVHFHEFYLVIAGFYLTGDFLRRLTSSCARTNLVLTGDFNGDVPEALCVSLR